jgi:phosphoglycerol transferase MdoB-like AlkP superfamily enzyme
MVAIFFIGRAALLALYIDKVQGSDSSIWLTFLYGLRMDTIVTSILLLLPLILLTLFPKSLQKFVEFFLKYYFMIVLSFLIYIENATFPFVAQYDVRPNYLFVEYLEYPKEVFGMIFAEYKVELFIAFSMIGIFIYFFNKKNQTKLDTIFSQPYFKRVLLFIPLLALLFIGVRSSFGHRPANISDAMYSSNRTLNEVTKNSLYSIVYAIYTNRVHGADKLVKQYGKMPLDEAYARVEKSLNLTNLKDKNSPLSRLEKTHFQHKKPKNLVIFVQESLGYQFVAAVGGEKGITPNLNRLAKEGILFTDLYSNGTRSVRGLAGLTSGNFSIPGKGVVKRNKSQSDYFTVAKLLKPYGYKSLFIYGGESRFDNMKGWYLGNGFDKIIDQEKFNNPSFVGTWGVCDEEVTQRANEEFKKMYAKGEKFVTVMFSTSNHSPFDFPDGKIKLIDGVAKKSVKNAIKYADFSIGAFIDQARKEDYYKDTIFVIAADHNVRVYGKDMVPVDMFHIPGLILGNGVKTMRYNHISTQPDILATALDLIGLDLKYPIMGHSIFSDEKRDISLMQFHNSYALREGNTVAVIRPGKAALTFTYKDKHLIPAKQHNKKLEKDALAFIIVLNNLYQNKLYR